VLRPASFRARHGLTAGHVTPVPAPLASGLSFAESESLQACRHAGKPQGRHAHKAYDRADLRKWLRGKRTGVRITRKGIESSE